MDRRATALLLLGAGLSYWCVVLLMLPKSSAMAFAAHFVSGLLTGLGITVLLRDISRRGRGGA